MTKRFPLLMRIIAVVLIYLWTAAAALWISDALDWQYDDGIGWWAVAIYSAPALAVSSPIFSIARDSDQGMIIALLILALLTAAALAVSSRIVRRIDRA